MVDVKGIATFVHFMNINQLIHLSVYIILLSINSVSKLHVIYKAYSGTTP